MTLSLTFNETLKWLSSLPFLKLKQKSFWWWQCGDIISLFTHLRTPSRLPFSPSLISLMVSVDVKHHAYLFAEHGGHALISIVSFRVHPSPVPWEREPYYLALLSGAIERFVCLSGHRFLWCIGVRKNIVSVALMGNVRETVCGKPPQLSVSFSAAAWIHVLCKSRGNSCSLQKTLDLSEVNFSL